MTSSNVDPVVGMNVPPEPFDYLGNTATYLTSSDESYFHFGLRSRSVTLFLMRYKCIPRDLNVSSKEFRNKSKHSFYTVFLLILGADFSAYIHVTTVLNYLRDELKHDLTRDITTQQYDISSKTFYVTKRLLDLGNGVMIDMTSCQYFSNVQNPSHYLADYNNSYFLTVQTIQFYFLPQHK
jgi:hypothetical protein